MNCYGALSVLYDELTRDVRYSDFIDFYKAEFANDGGEFRLILDLCCGTGTLTKMMSDEGYDMIAIDASESMLMEAQNKCPGVLFLCQEAGEIDLYGTVDAAYSSLDSINYIEKEELQSCFGRLKFFIRPGGLFIFDIRQRQWLEDMNGYTSVDEGDDYLCLWRADFEEDALIYGLDLFTKEGRLWKRSSEEHIEYAYDLEELKSYLEESGFDLLKTEAYRDRLFIVAKRNST